MYDWWHWQHQEQAWCCCYCNLYSFVFFFQQIQPSFLWLQLHTVGGSRRHRFAYIWIEGRRKKKRNYSYNFFFSFIARLSLSTDLIQFSINQYEKNTYTIDIMIKYIPYEESLGSFSYSELNFYLLIEEEKKNEFLFSTIGMMHYRIYLNISERIVRMSIFFSFITNKKKRKRLNFHWDFILINFRK
jgi:hypothetical protein